MRLSGLPGAITGPLRQVEYSPSFTSSRSPAMRVVRSLPWQWKQFADRIGRTSF